MEEVPQTTDSPVAARGRVPPGHRLLVFALALAVVLVDQLSKGLVEALLPLHTMWAPIPSLAHLFRITHVGNTGAVFGVFPAGGLLFAGIAAIVALLIVFYNLALPAGQFALRLALGLQLGGALGNLIDRLRQGHVTDYLGFGPWPVFNLADAAIVAGVCLLALAMWREGRVEAGQSRQVSEQSCDRESTLVEKPAGASIKREG